MTNRIKIKDRGWNRIVKEIRSSRMNRAAFVGIQGSQAEVAHGEYGTNVEIGSVHEFGSRDGRIPSRPFLRQPFDEHQSKYQKDFVRIYQMFLDGADVDGELLVLGEDYKQDVIDAIQSSAYQEWAESTRARKESEGKIGDVPLWDTSQLVNSISVRVGDAKHDRS